MLREGVFSGLPTESLPSSARLVLRLASWLERSGARRKGRAERLTNALNRLGPSWVKLGQFLATRPDVVGRELSADLESLQDRMRPFGLEEARQRVSASLGRDVESIFSSFSEPVAAASVAQVHRATRRSDGQTVAVKVIRPGVRDRFRADLDSFYAAARLQEKWIPAARRLRPVAVVDTLAQSARIEMDLRLEAAAFSEMAQNTRNDPGFRVPAVDWELTGRDCLTMEWVDGVKLTDISTIAAQGHDLNRIADTLVQSFLRHTLRDGFFHADMHPGNLFLAPDGVIVAVDLGITGRLGRKEQRFLAEILYGFITRDYRRVAQVHFEAGYVPAHHDVASFAQAIRAIGEPIHGQPAETISMARLLTLLFEVTELFDMQTRPELIMLQKTMVVVEGVARLLNPAFNMWKTAEPVVKEYLTQHIGPGGLLEDAMAGLTAARQLARSLPELARRMEAFGLHIEAMAAQGVALNPHTIAELGKARRSRSRWIMAAVIALIAFVGISWYFLH
jgi:ubiquinone biosynthesis protein